MPISDARNYHSLVICPSRGMLTELTPLLSQALPLAPVQTEQSYPSRKALMDLIKSFKPRLCFLDYGTDREQAFAISADLLSHSQTFPIVALLPSNDPDLILRCLRQGATEFLIRPITIEQVEASLAKIQKLQPAMSARSSDGGRTIAVVPAKGACGATTVGTALAYQCKKQGQKRVLLADLDALTGTISFLLKLKSGYSFLDVLNRSEELDMDLWKQLITTSAGLDVLLPPENAIGDLEDLADAGPIMDFAQAHYDCAVVDCSSAYGAWNLSIAGRCDDLLLVTTNELPALQAAQRVLSYYESQNIERHKIKVVVNRYERDIGLSSEIIGKALHTEVFQIVPSDEDAVQKSLMDGKPIAVGSGFGKGIIAMAERLVGTSNNKKKDSGGEKKSNSALSAILNLFQRASS